MTRLLSIAIFAILFFQTTFACDCNYNGNFFKMQKRTPLVALIKVTKYLTFDTIHNEVIPMSMKVEVINKYKGKETRKTFIVWGDNGNLCRPYISQFKEGQYYVIAFDSGNYSGGHPNEKDSDYSIFSCGCYWLSADIKKQTVTGDINSNDRTSTTISLKQLRKEVRKTTTDKNITINNIDVQRIQLHSYANRDFLNSYCIMTAIATLNLKFTFAFPSSI